MSDYRLLTPEDVARVLRISKSIALELMIGGSFETIRFGQEVRIRLNDLNEFIKLRTFPKDYGQDEYCDFLTRSAKGLE